MGTKRPLRSLWQALHEKHGIKRFSYIASYNGARLFDTTNLADINFKDGDSVELVALHVGC